MKRRYLVLFILSILILPSKIEAICDNSSVSLMQQYSKDVTYSYTYKEIGDNVTFDITFTNLRSVISIKNPIDNKNYSGYDEVTIKNLKPNIGYNFEIYATSLCPSTPLKTLYIEIPGYNKYYNDKICEGLEEFKYCQKWINLPFNYERLKNEVTKYKELVAKKEGQKKKEETTFEKIKKFVSMIFTKNNLVILSVIVTIGVIVMVLRDRKSDLN